MTTKKSTVRIEASAWSGPRYYTSDGLPLESGEFLGPVTVCYETWGSLNEDRSNAVLILHALSGDSGAGPLNDRPGWWNGMVGPGKAFDTNKYFVICSNVLGGCSGTTGPPSPNPRSGRPYALDFPLISIGDMVNAQRKLLDHLGIEKLLSAAGGSMGGLQALSWLLKYPGEISSVIPIAASLRHSPQQIAFNEVGRQAVMADPLWKGGEYYGGDVPSRGLALARMVGHITYMSDDSMARKFGRQRRNGSRPFGFNPDFEVEGYLHYRGNSFVNRFDANSYLYLTKAMDNFEASPEEFSGSAARTAGIKALVITFRSDWLYPPYQSREIAVAFRRAGIETTFCEVDSFYGHDAFLLEVREQSRLISHFLKKVYGNYEVADGFGI